MRIERDPETMAHIQPLTDAGVLVLAVVYLKNRKWHVGGSYPISAGLFNGLYHAEVADDVETAVENWLAWFDKQWEGL